jgi:hypothetical protein
LPVPNAEGKVYSKYGQGGSSDWGSANEVGPLPPKMSVPLVTSRVKESHDLLALGVDAGKICSLKRVTMVTREGQVMGGCGAAVAFGDDVVDFKGNIIVLLGHPAILAPRTCPAPNQLP